MTDAEIARMAFQAYRNAPPVLRSLQALRPSICPIERLLRQIPPGSRVLDVGCGAGLLLLAGASSGRVASGCGVDISEPALHAARSALAQIGKAAAITFQPAAAHDLPDGPFDVVTLVDVMHHVAPAEQRDFFAAAASRVRPGGILLYKDMCANPWWKAWANRLHDLVLARQWIHYVPLADVRGWAAGLGFSVARSEEYSRFWYGHELLVLRRG
jgi:2-polyprenyl-3-methyl-5-hydroxy-6-metoxy-1,4-benzoquinol methylase